MLHVGEKLYFHICSYYHTSGSCINFTFVSKEQSFTKTTIIAYLKDVLKCVSLKTGIPSSGRNQYGGTGISILYVSNDIVYGSTQSSADIQISTDSSYTFNDISSLIN